MTLGEFRILTATLPAYTELRMVDDYPVVIIVSTDDRQEVIIYITDEVE